MKKKRDHSPIPEALDPAASDRTSLWLGVFAVAFVLRAIYLLDARTSYPFFSHFIVDAVDYHAWAQTIAGGQWFGRRVFYLDPLYAYFLAALYALSGVSTVFVRWVQIAIGSLSCVLIAESARLLFKDRKVAWIAGFMAALYGLFVFYEGTLLKENLVVFFSSAVLWAFVTAIQQQSPFSWIRAGLLTGLLVLTRSNAMILVPLIALWSVLRLGRDARAFKNGALYAAAFFVAMLPSLANNYAAGGDVVLTVSKIGQIFYLGNNATSDGIFQSFVPERQDTNAEQSDGRMLAEAAVKRRLKPSEVSRYWLRQALGGIARKPGTWLKLMVRKTRLFLASYEIPDTEDYYLARKLCWPLRLPFLTYGMLFPAAVVGLFLIRRRFRLEAELLALLWAGNALSVILFFILARYRMPGVPVLIVCAAFFGGALGDWWKERSYRRVASSLCVWLGLCLLCRGANLAGTPGHVASASWIDAGEYYRGVKDFPKADGAFASALAAAPDDYMALNSLGASQTDQGRFGEAEASFKRVLALKPDYAKAHFNLGSVLESEGRADEALAEYRTAFDLAPSLTAAGINLANLLIRAGRAEEAKTNFQRVLAVEPRNATARYDFGLLLLAKDPRAAFSEFGRAIEANPRYAKAYDGRGAALLRLGDKQGAEDAFRQAAEIDPDDAVARNNLKRLQGSGRSLRSP